jgi:hypothetical protein
VREFSGVKVKNHQHQYIYQGFGLTIGSSIEIPELLPAEGEPDVLIREGSVPEALENPKSFGVRFQAKPGLFLLKVDNIAKYLVSEGRQVTIETFPGAEKRDIRLFLLSSVFGALVHQRGLLPLHASAIEVRGQCVMFCGASGSGKSTLANVFIKRGYHLHTDDVCVVSSGEDGKPMAYPGCPQLKLWEDALEKIGGDAASYTRVRRVVDKFAVPVTGRFNHKPLPIKRIYILSPWNKGEIEVSEITGMKKFSVLKNQTYRFRFLEGLEREVSHFKSAGVLGSQVPICGVRRPQSLFLLDELADILENDFIK